MLLKLEIKFYKPTNCFVISLSICKFNIIYPEPRATTHELLTNHYSRVTHEPLLTSYLRATTHESSTSHYSRVTHEQLLTRHPRATTHELITSHHSRVIHEPLLTSHSRATLERNAASLTSNSHDCTSFSWGSYHGTLYFRMEQSECNSNTPLS